MNLILFSLVFILFTFHFPYVFGQTTQVIDILPDFIGYLIFWIMLEKRRINRRMNGLYSVVSGMTFLSFLFFLGQIRFLFTDFLDGDGMIIGWILTALSYVFTFYNDLVLLIGVFLLAWFLFSLLGYWEQTNQHKLKCNICKAGIVGCGIVGLCYIGATLIILPFSWHWISYPLSLLLIAVAGFAMKDCPEMETGIRN